ncbi:unnamed protein product [Rhizophagus irregularis]|nr:unnamed protein product [Rhizophagus irregularis]CAB5194243.1 unnamed protein product [Rhizophagus irregularis]
MKSLELIPDIRTRWNSTFYMIERAFCLCEPLYNLAAADKELSPYLLNSIEWNKLKERQSLLECFQKATIEMNNIEDFLEEATRSDDIINAANNAKNKLQQYYPSSDGLVYVIATIIDPQHKLQYYIDNEFEVGSLAAYMFKKRKTSFTNELEAYLSELPENFDMDVLAFWKVNLK